MTAEAADALGTRYLAVSPSVGVMLHGLLTTEIGRLARKARETNSTSRRREINRQADALRALAEELAR